MSTISQSFYLQYTTSNSNLTVIAMALRAKEWNIVLVGKWNRAILTPEGIKKQLFKLEDDAALEVLIPLDTFAPPQVRYDNLTIIAGEEKIVIGLEKANQVTLQKACEVATSALSWLPITPVSAIGVNIRFKSDVSIEALEAATSQCWDDDLSNANLEILTRSIGRSVKRANGRINIFINEKQEDLSFELLFNFELISKDSEKLKEWVSGQAEGFKDECINILGKTLHIEIEDITYDDN